MKWFFDFLSNNSHEVYCWSWAITICTACLLFLLIIDRYWTQAYSEGYEQGFKDGCEESS
tara:strand:- start:17445 stop:17624 length:180 start_codon:yes stop_codon:yes gene_type:complete